MVCVASKLVLEKQRLLDSDEYKETHIGVFLKTNTVVQKTCHICGFVRSKKKISANNFDLEALSVSSVLSLIFLVAIQFAENPGELVSSAIRDTHFLAKSIAIRVHTVIRIRGSVNRLGIFKEEQTLKILYL